MASRVIPVETFDLVIFGGTGDLARRKILPGLFRRFRTGQMPSNSRIIGAARSELDQAGFQALVRDAIAEFGGEEKNDAKCIDKFLAQLDYTAIDVKGDAGWDKLAGMVRGDVVQVFYFSVAPSLFGDLAQRLHKHKIANESSRIVVEKPFGRDLETAKALNKSLADHFDESQIYRIDHYLGKET
ncbi:MAG: glucose-6-phosphate dehydrogenase, partial [Yoonia sp.]